MNQIRNGFNCEKCQWLKQLTNSHNFWIWNGTNVLLYEIFSFVLFSGRLNIQQCKDSLKRLNLSFEQLIFGKLLWLTTRWMQHVKFEREGYWLVYGRIGAIYSTRTLKIQNIAPMPKHSRLRRERRETTTTTTKTHQLIYAYLWWARV